MKKLLSIFAVFALVFTLAACGGEETAEDNTIKIGANIYSFDDNFMNGVVRPELERYVGTFTGVEIEIVDSKGDQAILNDQVDVFISKGVDVLAINLVNPASAKAIIDKAKAADIPLILFNKENTEAGAMDSYDKVWYVGTDSAEAGIIQGEMMVADWLANPEWDLNSDGVLDYVLLKGEPGHPDAEARTREAVKAFVDAGITVNELALQASPTWNTADANNTMQTWLSGSFADQIELVICNNDGMAFGAFNAMDSADHFIPVYGVDALAEALTMIGADELNGTVLNDGVNQARATIDLAIMAALGATDPTGAWELDALTGTKAVRVAYVAVTKENYTDFQ
jgi:methyl-galactoside transport system substrate-binding protein